LAQVRILKDFKSNEFVSADFKEVVGDIFGSADSREFGSDMKVGRLQLWRGWRGERTTHDSIKCELNQYINVWLALERCTRNVAGVLAKPIRTGTNLWQTFEVPPPTQI
jgi:hypothetical protein